MPQATPIINSTSSKYLNLYQHPSDASYLNQKCQEAMRSAWSSRGFRMNLDIDEIISRTITTESLIKSIRRSTFFDEKHNRILNLAESNLKEAKAVGEYSNEFIRDLCSTFLAIGSDIFYKTEGITMGKKPDERPLTKPQAKALIVAQPPPKAKATTKETFTLVSRPLDRFTTASTTQSIPGAFPTPLNTGHRNLSLVNMAKYGTALEDSREYDPDDDPELEVVEEEVDWEMVSDGGKE